MAFFMRMERAPHRYLGARRRTQYLVSHLSFKIPLPIALVNRAHGWKTNLRQLNLTVHLCIAFAVSWSHDGYVMNHVPFDAVVAAFQSTHSVSTKHRPSHIAEQAEGGGYIQQD